MASDLASHGCLKCSFSNLGSHPLNECVAFVNREPKRSEATTRITRVPQPSLLRLRVLIFPEDRPARLPLITTYYQHLLGLTYPLDFSPLKISLDLFTISCYKRV